MKEIISDLYKLQDKKYRNFQVKLIPSIAKETVIGVRTPELRKYAKEILKAKKYESSIQTRIDS